MAVYQFTRHHMLNTSLLELWEFISSPKNLTEITPAYMGFEITSAGNSSKMYPGMVISYKVSPLSHIRMNWLTEITQVKEKEFFVDEQRLGPYRIWHHEHHLIPKDEGVLMTDIITYVPPFGFLGTIANKLFIRRKLEEIFNYREQRLDEIFNQKD